MVKLGWSPAAAETVLALSNADQRRVVDVVGELRSRLEHEAATFAGDMEHRITASGYDICFRLSAEGAEVQSVSLGTDHAWKT